MKQENQTLKEELQAETKKSTQNDQNLSQRMELLQEESTSFARKIEMESKKKRDLEQLIEGAENTLQMTRKKINSSDGIELPHLQKKQKTLETQLEQIKQKHNESLAEINQMKEQINVARRERVIFSNVFKKLETDIRLKEEEFKKQLLIRKQVEQDLQIVDLQFQKMKDHADNQLKELQKQYDDTFKAKQKEQDEKIPTDQDFMSKFFDPNEKLLNSNILDLSQQRSQSKLYPINNTAATIQKAYDEVDKYELLFEKLRKETSINDVEEIIHLFKTIDELNNELYQQANKLNDEIDAYEREIEDVQREIGNYTKQKQENDLSTKEIQAARLEYDHQQRKIDLVDDQIGEITDEILMSSEELMKIADILGLDPKSFLSDGEVNEWNTRILLQKVEQRANELIDLCRFFENQTVDIELQRHEQHSISGDSKILVKEDQQMVDLLDNVEREKEAEKIMTMKDFQEMGQKELSNFKKRLTVKKISKKTNNEHL